MEYEPGKFGRVDRIGYEVETWRELDEGAKVDWTMTGKKINKTGNFGVKDFQPVGPGTHFPKGTTFKFKGVGGTLGISGPDDD